MKTRPWARIDIAGQRFGKLIALRWAPRTDRRTRWVCKCDCGQTTNVVLENLRYGHTISCGCETRRKRYPKRDLAGKRFGKLLVVEFVGRQGGESLWRCQCDCGNEPTTKGQNLLRGLSRSCGCTIRAALLRVNIKHGKTGTAEYRVWAGMLTRCYNKRDAAFRYYGGRGISVCRRWRGEQGFQNFFTDVGLRPSPKHSLDRIKVNSNYTPKNCRWATKEQQASNKRNTIWVSYKGKKLALGQACRAAGVDYYAIRSRLRSGMKFKEAVSKPWRVNDENTIAARSRKAGLRSPTVFARLRAGWDLERALSTPVMHNGRVEPQEARSN